MPVGTLDVNDGRPDGRVECDLRTAAVDAQLAALFEEHFGGTKGLALCAVGGYGSGLLAPRSDLDIVLLRRKHARIDGIDRLWYPLWDDGWKVGHAVRTPSETRSLARDDLATATSLLSMRHLAGDRDLTVEVATRSRQDWAADGRRRLAELSHSVEERHAGHAEVAFALEPDLKSGRGGLRDLHAIRWAIAAGAAHSLDLDALSAAEDLLLAIRNHLHRIAGRGDVVVLQEQDTLAATMGFASADELMTMCSRAGRQVALASDEFWYDVDVRAGRRHVPSTVADARFSMRDGRLELDPAVAPTPQVALELATVAARESVRMGRSTVARLATAAGPAQPWSEELRAAFVGLLVTGAGLVPAVEVLDDAGIFVQLVPEWADVQSRPQRNAYHRFTVDRHLTETVASAGRLLQRVARPDLLVLGALFHDIGKVDRGDHTDVGVELVLGIGKRMGMTPEDVGRLQGLVREHLLLPDTATRRDLDDPVVIDAVASRVGDLGQLELLAAMVVADSEATGPAAWSTWKAGLIDTLVGRVRTALGGEAAEEPPAESNGHADAALVAAVRADGQPHIEAHGEWIVVAAPDRPGLMGRLAGALALSACDVEEAVAGAEGGVALDRFRVDAGRAGLDVERVRRMVTDALAGRLALSWRLAERHRSYRRTRPPASMLPLDVRVINDESDRYTVIEVLGPDSVGLLYRLASALGELDVDIVQARVSTLGDDVVDSFYVHGAHDGKITDPQHVAEIRAALLHALQPTS